MANDDLFAYGDSGNSGGGGTPGAGAMTGDFGANQSSGYWGGEAGRGHFDDNWNWVVDRESGVQQDVNRYRQMGQQAADRSAFHGNYSDFNDAASGFNYGQGRARGAMDLQQAAAEGRAPSAAEIAGRQAIDQSITAQMAVGASARGGALAQAAATRGAATDAGAFRQNALATLAANKANEMASARNAYAGSSFQYGQNQMGQQGLQLGKTAQQIQTEQFQRGLNQQAQQFNESKAFDTKSQGLASDFARSGQNFQQLQSTRQEERADKLADMQQVTGYANAGSNLIPKQPSDERAKNVLMSVRDGNSRKSPYGEARREIDLDDDVEFSDDDTFDADAYDRRMSDRSDIFRGDPYDTQTNQMLDDRLSQQPGTGKPAAFLDSYIADQREKPQATASVGASMHGQLPQFAYSDTNAKKDAAFQAGVKAGVRAVKQPSVEQAAQAKSGAQGRGLDASNTDAKTGAITMSPVTVEGTPRDYGDTSPRPWDDSAFEHAKNNGFAEQYWKNVEGDEAWNRRKQETRDRPVNLNGDAYVPPAFQAPAPRPEGPLAYSDDRTKEDAARRLESKPYTYKDKYLPKEQKRGEMNFGPMAQEMEKNPLTATAVEKDPKGMRLVDMSKLVKTQSGLIAHLQEQIDEMKGGRRHG